MQRRFAKTIEEMRGLINEWSAPDCHSEPAGESVVLLAVSGGIDSMCMADLWLRSFGSESFAVAHCNFHLRGEESDGDEALVRGWALKHDVQLHVKDFDTVSYAREHNISIEMAARELRYAWFGELCLQHGYKAVSVAHNANDNAETLVLNMLRGAGLKGLTGMKPISPLPVDTSSRSFRGIYLLRPLLDCTRKQIEGYVYAHKVMYRDDSTNASSDYKRNRIRNEAFPIFEKVNPSFVNTMNREMGYFSEAEEIVEDWCRSAAASVVRNDDSENSQVQLRVDVPKLLAYRHWRYLLYHILEPYGFNSAVLASLEDLLASSRTISGKRFESQEHVLITGRDELTLSYLPKVCVQEENAIMPVRGEGTYHFNGHAFKVEVLEWNDSMSLKQPEGVLIFDAAKLRFPFVLRKWRSGDWLVPLGMRGKKKVSDLFADLKYDSFKKSAAVMVVDTCTDGMAGSQHMAAVAGVRIDSGYKVTERTTSIIRLWSVSY